MALNILKYRLIQGINNLDYRREISLFKPQKDATESSLVDHYKQLLNKKKRKFYFLRNHTGGLVSIERI